MADRRRRRRVKSDEESEEISSESDVEPLDASFTSTNTPEKKEGEKAESEYESAEEEEEEPVTTAERIEPKNLGDDVESATELIDEEGGEEGIAEAEDVEGEFLDGDIIGASDDEDEENVEEERQQGDGEECSPVAEKELDFDEDRRNPQYIPKKGTFYEHDDRNLMESPKEKEAEPVRDKKKKKLWLDEGKWGHDRYREDEQTPKSRDELIEVYGYDIRCEDCPPRARRRRRYGRGPTKYERSWKDETAYAKEQIYNIFRGGGRRGRGRGGQFPGNSVHGSGRRVARTESITDKESDGSIHHNTTDEVPESSQNDWNSENVQEEGGEEQQEQQQQEQENVIIINNEDFPALSAKEPPIKSRSPERNNIAPRMRKMAEVSEENHNNSVRTQTFENSNFTNRSKPPVYEKPPRQTKAFGPSGTYRGAYKRPPRIVRGKRNTGGGQYRGNRDNYTRPNLAPRLMEKQIRAVTAEMEHFTINDKTDSFDNNSDAAIVEDHKTKVIGNKQMNGQSSKNEDSSIRSKRYSSLRQRSLPEASNYQPQQAPTVAPPHPSYYDATYQTTMYAPEGVVAPPSSQPQTTGSPPIISPPQYQAYNPAAYQESYALRLPVNNMNNAPRLFPQVTLPAGQPIIAPTPCIPANPGLINYPPPPPPPASAYPQFTYQQYPAPPPAPPAVSQPPEMYRSGITYYYPQNQHPNVRHVPLKRPKAAIPIVPPPENEFQRKAAEKKDYGAMDDQRRNSLTCSGDSSNGDCELIRTEASSVQSPVEVES